jgi:hypothetical protein
MTLCCIIVESGLNVATCKEVRKLIGKRVLVRYSRHEIVGGPKRVFFISVVRRTNRDDESFSSDESYHRCVWFGPESWASQDKRFKEGYLRLKDIEVIREVPRGKTQQVIVEEML